MAFEGASVVALFGFLAGSWAVVMGVSPLLQVRRMRERQSSADVSIGYLFILFPGFALWIAYGLASSDLALVIPNIVALIICAVTIGYALKLRPGGQLIVAQPTKGVEVSVIPIKDRTGMALDASLN
jgi:MtN3 and saliva related transmembrane protein